MKKDKHKTSVIFRKFKKGGDIIAIFPYLVEPDGFVMSYMHLGQHSSASLSLINDTTLANENEYKDLFCEIENAGYNLKVIKRVHSKTYYNELRKLRKLR